MTLVLTILAAIAVAIALVVASNVWFGRVQKRRFAERIGIEALSARHWRDTLARLVEALGAQGYAPESEPTAAQGAPLGERRLVRGGSSTLLLYKHGTAYRIGAPALLDAERRRQEAGVDSVIVATLGSIEPDALAQADRMRVTVLDGPALWALLRPGLDAATREAIDAESEQQIDRPRRLAGVGSGLLGLGIVFWGADLDGHLQRWLAPSAQTQTASAPSSAAPRESVAAPAVNPGAQGVMPVAPDSAASAADAAAPGAAPEADVDTTTPSAGEPRAAVAKALVTLPGVDSATWSSGSTLVLTVSRRATIDSAYAEVCGLADQFPLLREARLQLEGSGGADVRWRRCP